ncbi:Exosome complex component RRP45, partial [Perkinsus chesapeaki]
MAAPATLPSGDSSGLVGSSQTPEGVSLCNQLERMLKGSSAVDVEALCVSSGLLVWNLRLDVHILADCGNVGDAAAIASIVALRHYRKADVDIEDGEVIYRPQSDPVPISVHHMPIPVTFAIIPSDSDMPPVLLADPTSLEEGLHGNRGQLVLAMNQYGQLCSLLKSGGAPLLLDRDILPAVRLATLRAKTIIDLINKKLSDDEYKRVEVHKADIHHKYTTTGLSLGPFFQNNASAHHRKRSIAHFEMLKPMDGVEEQTGINIEEDPQYDQSYSQKPILAPRTYSISNKPQDSPELIRVVPPAPVVGQPEVAKSDDDDLDDLSAAVLVKPKKKRRPR